MNRLDRSVQQTTHAKSHFYADVPVGGREVFCTGGEKKSSEILIERADVVSRVF